PAGHLPHLGGDRTARLLSPISKRWRRSEGPKLLIFPPVGKMSGRTEGWRCPAGPVFFAQGHNFPHPCRNHRASPVLGAHQSLQPGEVSWKMFNRPGRPPPSSSPA
ncbi:MAG: hypothetical protein EOS64_30360, partial [Mesorhizobium sp.]